MEQAEMDRKDSFGLIGSGVTVDPEFSAKM